MRLDMASPGPGHGWTAGLGPPSLRIASVNGAEVGAVKHTQEKLALEKTFLAQTSLPIA